MALTRLDPADEANRVLAAAAGDQAAWTSLLEAHRDRLRRMVALRLNPRMRGRVDPSDVIQEAYIDATRGLKEFADRGEMSLFLWLRWLTAMKLNEAHRIHLGYQIRDAAREVSIDGNALPQASSAAIAAHLIGRESSASGRAMRKERTSQLQAALEQLEPLDREVLALRHFEELSNAEIAHALGIGESAASKRYARAIRRLRKLLSEMPGGVAEFGL
jgi:RNA polymerase sigma-70 factor (ECF subfamily)